jgi:hypothetical protein
MKTAAINIKNSKFIANTVGNDGSAIHILDTLNAKLQDTESYIENTLFSGNI